MNQWVLKQNGQIVPRRKMRRLTPEEWAREIEIKKRSEFNDAIKEQYGDSFSLPDKTLKNLQNEDDTDDLPSDEVSLRIPKADIIDGQVQPLHPSSAADLLMNAEVLLPQAEEKRLAKVIKRSIDSDGKVIGKYNEIPVLNTMLYDVQFPDGSIKPYSAKIIAENILMQADGAGLHHQLLDGILDTPRTSDQLKRKTSILYPSVAGDPCAKKLLAGNSI